MERVEEFQTREDFGGANIDLVRANGVVPAN